MACPYLDKKPNLGMTRERYSYVCDLGGEISTSYATSYCETRYGYERCGRYLDHNGY